MKRKSESNEKVKMKTKKNKRKSLARFIHINNCQCFTHL